MSILEGKCEKTKVDMFILKPKTILRFKSTKSKGVR